MTQGACQMKKDQECTIRHIPMTREELNESGRVLSKESSVIQKERE